MCLLFFFFFNDTATTEIYTLSLHDALPIRDGLGLHARRGLDCLRAGRLRARADRKSTRLNSSHVAISYADFCLKKKNNYKKAHVPRPGAHVINLSGEGYSLMCPYFFFFNDTATTEIYTLSLHDALPTFALTNLGVLPMGTRYGELTLRSIGFCAGADRKSTRLNSSHVAISYAVFCL